MKQKRGLITGIIFVLAIVLLFAAYNIFRFPARFRSLTDESLDEEAVAALKEEIAQKENKRILVAYFSYSGTT